jgi:hypothetical protein
VLVCAGLASGCLVKTQQVPPTPVVTRTATLPELIEKLGRFSQIQTVKASVELQLSVENDERTEIQEFRDAPGYILARRPREILAIAQVPVVRSTAFRMASDGVTFQVHLPSRNRFFVGEAALEQRSAKRSENIRPSHVLDVVLIKPPEPEEIGVLENLVEGVKAYQVVLLMLPDGSRQPRLTRKFWFDRATLELARMQVFDGQGNAVTNARFEDWQQENTLPYARVVTMERPADGYKLRIRFDQPGLNQNVPEDSFQLEAPSGVTVERLGEVKVDHAQAVERQGAAAR